MTNCGAAGVGSVTTMCSRILSGPLKASVSRPVKRHCDRGVLSGSEYPCRAGWVSCAAQDRGMPSHAAIFASTSVGHAEIRKLAESPGRFITGVVACAESASRMPSRIFSTRRTRFGSASSSSRRAPPLSSTTRASPLASSRARSRVRPARLNASSLPLPAITDAMSGRTRGGVSGSCEMSRLAARRI